MKTLKVLCIMTVLTASIFTTSCNKEDVQNGDVDQKLMKASTEIDFTNELDFKAGVDAATTHSSYAARQEPENVTFDSCPVITVNNTTPGVFPKTFTLDFGSGCMHNGVLRAGTLTITLSDYLMHLGSVMTIVRSDNYYVNGRKVEGTIVYENQTSNPETPQWTRTLTNGKITNLASEVFTHSGTRTVKQMGGVGTLTLGDNVYHILSGTHTVSRPNGTSLTVTVVETLIKNYACEYISQGKLDLQGTYLNGILDYGENTCDNQATYTHSNGQVYPITL